MKTWWVIPVLGAGLLCACSGGDDSEQSVDAVGGSAGPATGGAQGGSADGSGGSPAGSFSLPPENAGFDYQIGGGYTPPVGVSVISRDRLDQPEPGLYNICYVNGFQIQPDEEAWWLSEHPDLILRDSGGDPVIDPDWDEMLLDTSTEEKRAALADIFQGWIAGCKDAGFDATEIDNLDTYSRSGGLLSKANNVAMMALYSDLAHQNGLASGQKNSTEILDQVAAMKTDFAVAEECNRYDECQDYQAAYGDRVYVIEYRQVDFVVGCNNFTELSIVLRDLDVSTPGESSYVYDGC